MTDAALSRGAGSAGASPRLKRVAFAGTPAFAAAALEAIGDAGFPVVLVLTQPDRPAGRGMKLVPSPVKQLALERGWPVAQPRSLRRDGKYPDDAAAAERALQQARPDVMVVAAYGLILPQWVLTLPPHGCLNIHASLLPRWRGAAPIQRAIEAGDAQTGISIMQMDAGLDTGPECLREALAIEPDDDAGTLHDRLAPLGARLIVQALQRLDREGRLPATPQPDDGVTYAHKLDKAQARIDWGAPAAVIERRARAFDPAPGLFFELDDGQALKLWRARVVRGEGAPGQVLDAGAGQVVVACGEGALELLTVQRPGGRRQPVADFLRARPLPAGTRLPLPPG